MVNPNPSVPSPPQPVPELWQADRWQFAALPAGELWDFATSQPIPIQSLSPERLGKQASPLSLGLASTVLIPGVILQGGRKSRFLAQWLEEQHPVRLDYVPGELHGLILHSGPDSDRKRWVMATFDDLEVARAGEIYRQRLSLSQGLHFLLLQPDDSGQTYTGIWLLQA